MHVIIEMDKHKTFFYQLFNACKRNFGYSLKKICPIKLHLFILHTFKKRNLLKNQTGYIHKLSILMHLMQ